MEMSDEIHKSASLPLGTEAPHPMHRRLGGPKSQSGLFLRREKCLAPSEFVNPVIM